MDNLNPIIVQVMRELLNSGRGAAEAFVRDNLTKKVEELRRELERLQAEESAAKNIIFMAALAPAAETTPLQVKTDPLLGGLTTLMVASNQEEDRRRSKIIEAAESVALVEQVVTTEAVVKALAERGISLPGARPGTSVGNVLHRSPDWVRVGEGKFQKKREESLA